jgi:hypothetical protein
MNTTRDSRVWSAAVIMSLGKRTLKKSALGCYKRDLRQVSHQTIQDRAVCKTQAGNVFMSCLTRATGTRMNERDSSRVRKHKDAANGGDRAWSNCTFSQMSGQ